MKTLLTAIILLLLSSPISGAEFRPDPVRAFIESQPGIAIDMTGLWNEQKVNHQLKPKNFKPGATREWR